MINFCFRVYRKLVYPAHKSFLSVVFFVVIAVLGFTVSLSSVLAEGYPKYGPNETVIIGEFIYDDNFEPATSSCSIIIQNTSGVVVVPTTTLTTSTNGWQSYTFSATSTEGIWPTTIICGSIGGGDLAKLDKTFIIGNTAVSTSSIASSVWNSAVRTLTSGASIADDIWNASTRSLTTFGTIVTDIWTNPTRTLTSFGTLLADIWSDVASPNRRLTSGSLTDGGVLASEAFVTSTIQSATSSIISEVIANRALINALNDISAADVWAHSGRTLTDYATSSISAAVWTVPTSTFSQFGSIGNLIASNLDAQISSRGTSTLSAADVWNAATRSLTDYSTSSIALGVWANSARTLTSYGNDITAADVWDALTSTLSTIGSIGSLLATNIDTAISTRGSLANQSTIITEVMANQTLISALNDISAADVWAYSGRTLTDYATSSISAAVWAVPTSTFSEFGSIGNLVATNLDTKISTRGTSTLSAADVWNATTRSLTDYSTSSIALGVWSNAARTLTNYGNDITAFDVWNAVTSTLTTVGSIGNQLATNVDVAASTRASLAVQTNIYNEVLANQSLISALDSISAADVWAYSGRSLTDYATSSISAAIWEIPTATLSQFGTVGRLLVDNLDAQVSTRGTSTLSAADVWNAATRSLTDYSTSSIALGVWANSARTLTDYGNNITAGDVWNVLTSTLSTVGSIGVQFTENIDTAISTRAASVSEDASWTVRMSDVDSVSAGKTYRTKVYLFDSQSVPTNPASVPEISLYDASRNVVVSSVAMSAVSTGIYEYTYSVANNAEGGLWEAVIETEVESGKIIETNDYWLVAASPAQVLINSMTDTLGPSVAANVTITNEGLSGYEYQYEWCIVTSVDNPCGGGNDTYHATAAKFINPGEDFNTTLTGTIAGAGSYYFKLVVYFGTESSGASRSFTATYTAPPDPTPGGGGGGGGGGGAFIPPTTPVVTPTTTPAGVCTGADFNHDTKVNSIDFSILLAFWKTAPPFRNPCVDVNVDTKVDSVDFSILMYNWGKNN